MFIAESKDKYVFRNEEGLYLETIVTCDGELLKELYTQDINKAFICSTDRIPINIKSRNDLVAIAVIVKTQVVPIKRFVTPQTVPVVWKDYLTENKSYRVWYMEGNLFEIELDSKETNLFNLKDYNFKWKLSE